MANVGFATLQVIPSMKGVGSALSAGMVGPAGVAGAESGAVAGKKFGGSLVGGIKGYVGPLAAVGVAMAGISFFKGAFAEAQEAAKAGALTASVIEATGGAAHVTQGQVEALATALSNKIGVDDEEIQAGENMLLTFKNIANQAGEGNDIFSQSTSVLADMSAAMGTDMSSSAIQLGKALNDPIAGMGALGRVGVQFSDAQKEQIKAMVASGDLMGAQKVILGELKTEFGGAAEALATPADKAKVAWSNFKELIGTKMMPVVNAVLTGLTSALTWIMGLFTQAGDSGSGLGKVIAFVFGGIGKGIALVRTWLLANRATFQKWWASLVAIWDRLKVLWAVLWRDIKAFWDRYGAQILATLTSAWRHIAAIIGIFWDQIKNMIDTALRVIRDVINFWMAIFQGHWSDAWNALMDILAAFVSFIWNSIKNLFKYAVQLFGLGMDLMKQIWQFEWDAVKAIVVAIFDGIVAWVAALPGRFLAAGALIWDWIREKATHIAADVVAAVASFFAWVQGLPALLAAWGATIWDWIVEKALHVAGNVIAAFQSFKEWIQALPATLAGWAGDVWQWIVDQAQAAGARAWDAFKGAFLEGFGAGWTIGGDLGDDPHFKPPVHGKGGIATRAQLGVIGEAGPEAILPLDRFERMLDKAYAAGQGGGGAQSSTTTINVHNPINEPTSTTLRRLHDRRTVFA